jgi:hypothetical protein
MARQIFGQEKARLGAGLLISGFFPVASGLSIIDSGLSAIASRLRTFNYCLKLLVEVACGA